MGVNADLEFDKFCKVGRSPRNVLPAPRHESKGENNSKKVKHSSRKESHKLLNSEEGFTEIKFRNYRSISCKNLPSGDVELECDEVVRRGSVCSSRERKFRPETRSGRKKIEFSRGGESPFSFSILESICNSDEEAEDEPEQNRPFKVSLNSETVLSTKPLKQLCSADVRDRQVEFVKSAERDSMEKRKLQCPEVSGPLNTANVLKERDFLALNESVSASLALPRSPTHSEGNNSFKGSPKSRFAPFRKMFDPLIKSKSYRNPSSDAKLSGLTEMRAKTLRNSMQRGFSSAVSNVEATYQPVKKDWPQVVPLRPCLPANLRGNLKREQKHGVPYFEFSMVQSEDVYVAKSWKAEDALSWVYTFQSVRGRKKSNATARGVKYCNNDSPMVGQMQVKCYLCTELKSGGSFSDSMMTEFVLYDIGHARKSVTSEEGINSRDINNVFGASLSSEVSGEGNVELDDLFSLAKPRMPMTSAFDRISTDFLSPYPLSPADLHPRLEIAAVVVQVPLESRDSVKYKRVDRFGNQVHPNVLDLTSVLERAKNACADNKKVKVNVVIPPGYHTLPNGGEIRGPSSLLDRWRSGGGCDCGGWDVACPPVVFSIPTTQCSKEDSLVEKSRPLKFYVQGGKENVPALTITATEKGQYTVDFHTQLSTLQAFGVCVSILHTSEASSLVEREKSKELLQCNSLKVPVEDEVKILIEAVTEQEKKKVAKTVEGNATVFVPNPPFSPIARV